MQVVYGLVHGYWLICPFNGVFCANFVLGNLANKKNYVYDEKAAGFIECSTERTGCTMYEPAQY